MTSASVRVGDEVVGAIGPGPGLCVLLGVTHDDDGAVARKLVDELRALGATVATGRFQTEMKVAIENDGPVTVLVEVP